MIPYNQAPPIPPPTGGAGRRTSKRVASASHFLVMEMGDKPADETHTIEVSVVLGRKHLPEGLEQGRNPLPLLVTGPALILKCPPNAHTGLVTPGAGFQPYSVTPDICVGSRVLVIGGAG